MNDKNQENSAHRFGGNYLTSHLMKFLQDRIKPGRGGALRVNTGYKFFQTNSLVRFHSFFDSSCDSC